MGRAIGLVLFACACNSNLTGIELRVDRDRSLLLDQIAVAGVMEDGSAAFPPGVAPDPPRPLGEGDDTIVLLLPEGLGGRTVDLSITGKWSGDAVAEGRGSALVVAGSFVELPIRLKPIGEPSLAPDAGSSAPDAGEAREDAGTSDAGRHDAGAGVDACVPGTTCDDGSDGTRNDVCLGPSCRGYQTSDCGSSCDGCGPGGCCRRDCRGATCPSCPAGCSCDMRCKDRATCMMTCEAGSVCHLAVKDLEDARLVCADGASCDLECDDSSCTLECTGGAFCIISSCRESSCALECDGAPMSCPNGSRTCNRACP